MSVTEEDEAGAGLVGDGGDGLGDVLGEHPGLVDDQDIAVAELRRLIRAAVLGW